MPISSIQVGAISNNTYNAELEGIASDIAIRLFTSYGNVDISDNTGTPMLNMTINDYSRVPATYDTQGNILTFRYNAGISFSLNDSTLMISGSKILNSLISEPEAQDSVMSETVRKYIDRLRSDF